MTFPSLTYPSFCKPRPCTRAVRIQRDLSALAPGSGPLTRSTRQILHDILALLTRKSVSLESRIDTLQDLLTKLPPWTEWTNREDDVVSSALQALPFPTADTREPYTREPSVVEEVLATELITLHGNVPTLSARDFRDVQDIRFLFFYTNWLRNVSSPDPEEKDCHVQDEHGQWISDDMLREKLERGWSLHIPTRRLGRFPDVHAPPKEERTSPPPPPPPPRTSTAQSPSRRISLLEDIRNTPGL